MRFLCLFFLLTGLGLPPCAGATTWHVNPEGTGDAPTILAAIDSCAAGDVIELACGTYHESTTMATMLTLKSDLTLRSAGGDPACVTIDAQQPLGWGSVLYLVEVSNVLIQGLTITGGDAVDVFLSSNGGGAYIRDCQNIRFEDCFFTGNRGRAGGGLFVTGSEVSLERCVITENEALVAGGGISLTGNVQATDCLILDNSAGHQLGPDGFVWEMASSCVLTCCDKDLAQWLVSEGSLLVEDENCGSVAIEGVEWTDLKAMYR